jgi:hypothetical protein
MCLEAAKPARIRRNEARYATPVKTNPTQRFTLGFSVKRSLDYEAWARFADYTGLAEECLRFELPLKGLELCSRKRIQRLWNLGEDGRSYRADKWMHGNRASPTHLRPYPGGEPDRR